MSKSETRGKFKMAICREQQIAAYQWMDSRIVTFVSSYFDFRVSEVKRQVGPQQKSFQCPSAVVQYQKNMGGINKGDQMRSHFGGFAAQSHFKKWYKKNFNGSSGLHVDEWFETMEPIKGESGGEKVDESQ